MPGAVHHRPSREHLPLALLALMLAACAPPQKPPPRTPPPPRAPLVDVDTESCRTMSEGRLFSREGSVFFDGRPEAGEPGERSVKEADVADPLSRDAGETLLPMLSGRFSTFLPHREFHAAFAVRTGAPLAGEPPGDVLVNVDPGTLRLRRFWAADGRLRLIGRVGERAILLIEDVQGTRVASVDPLVRAVVLSPPFEVPPALWTLPRPEVPLPFAAALGWDRFLILCGQGRLCLIIIAEEQIDVQQLGVLAEGLGLWRSRLFVREPKNRCRFPDDRPVERWSRKAARPCPRALLLDAPRTARPGLWVDGVLSSGARLRVPSCLVRSEIVLPPLPDPSDLRRPGGEPRPGGAGAGLLLLPVPDEVKAELSLDLLLRGRSLKLGFTALDGDHASTLKRELGVALPPGSVSVRRLPDRPLYLVQVRSALPFDAGSACWTGQLVLRVSNGEDDLRDVVFAHRPWEFGKCR